MAELTLPRYPDIPAGDDPSNFPDYRSTAYRFPKRPLFALPQGIGEITGPLLGEGRVGPHDHDLTAHGHGEPLGERIIVHGRLLDSGGRPIPTSSSRSGRPTPAAATSTRSTSTPRRWTRTSPASAAA